MFFTYKPLSIIIFILWIYSSNFSNTSGGPLWVWFFSRSKPESGLKLQSPLVKHALHSGLVSAGRFASNNPSSNIMVGKVLRLTIQNCNLLHFGGLVCGLGLCGGFWVVLVFGGFFWVFWVSLTEYWCEGMNFLKLTSQMLPLFFHLTSNLNYEIIVFMFCTVFWISNIVQKGRNVFLEVISLLENWS